MTAKGGVIFAAISAGAYREMPASARHHLAACTRVRIDAPRRVMARRNEHKRVNQNRRATRGVRRHQRVLTASRGIVAALCGIGARHGVKARKNERRQSGEMAAAKSSWQRGHRQRKPAKKLIGVAK